MRNMKLCLLTGQDGLCPSWSETPDRFSRNRACIVLISQTVKTLVSRQLPVKLTTI